jgi:hypothetical protein
VSAHDEAQQKIKALERQLASISNDDLSSLQAAHSAEQVEISARLSTANETIRALETKLHVAEETTSSVRRNALAEKQSEDARTSSLLTELAEARAETRSVRSQLEVRGDASAPASAALEQQTVALLSEQLRSAQLEVSSLKQHGVHRRSEQQIRILQEEAAAKARQEVSGVYVFSCVCSISLRGFEALIQLTHVECCLQIRSLTTSESWSWHWKPKPLNLTSQKTKCWPYSRSSPSTKKQ